MLTHRKTLGLALTEQGITAVEIETSALRQTVLHTAVLPFGPEASLAEPEKLGKALRQALRASEIGTSRCVIGLPSTFLASREKVLPAADAESLRGVLSIAAEREFASGPQELAFDYYSSPMGKSVLAMMMAAPRRLMDQLSAMAASAGLTITAVTSSAACLALATGGTISPAGRLVLCLLPDGAELSAQSVEGLRLIRRVAVRPETPDSGEKLVSELRRVLAAAPAQQDSDQPRDMLVWNSALIAPATLKTLDNLPLRLKLCTLAGDLGLSSSNSSAPASDMFAQAGALARGAGQSPPIDFLHSRLAAPKKARLGSRALWAIAAAAVLLAAGVYLVLDLRASQQDVTRLQGELEKLKTPTQEARTVIDNVNFAGTWYDKRPAFLNCIREITKAFPDEGRIWATTLVIREDMQATLTGKATSKAATLEVLDGLTANPRLSNVKPLYIRQAAGTSREVSFAVSLNLRGAQ